MSTSFSTPTPLYSAAYQSGTSAPADRMLATDRIRLEQAAFRARKVYPGAIGELIATELDWWATLGYRLLPKSVVLRVADEVLAARLPDIPA